MKVYAALDDPRLPLREVPAWATRAERIGFHGVLVPEAVHDGFLTALLALEHTSTLHVATSVTVAFPRSPTTVAYSAWDLQSLSNGRFTLGLGSQIKGNIVGRFGTAWAPPVARMRDYVGAVRAVWRCWQDGTPLAFESEHYRLTRMQPFFNPGPIDHPEIPIFLGGVNPGMLALAGDVADGLMTHPTNSGPRFLRERCLPALSTGTGPTPGIIASAFVATGPDAASVAQERENLRQYFGFLYSTPQYWPTLELHGWDDLGPTLRDHTREGRWQDMPALVTDEILDALVATGTYDEIGPVLREWYGELAAGITLRMPADPTHDAVLGRVIAALA